MSDIDSCCPCFRRSRRPDAAPTNVSVDFDGATVFALEAFERYVANGLMSRGVWGIDENRLDKDAIFDDHAWVVIRPVRDMQSGAFAWDVQFSILEGAPASYTLCRFRRSLTQAVISGTRDATLFAILDELMDEVKAESGSATYRSGWHPVSSP